MANVNYTNPEGMYPLSTGDRSSPALGAGTTPGSFLAGWNLPDRMNDYATARDLSNTASRLGNEHMADTNMDFRGSMPSRQSGYDLSNLGNQLDQALLPNEKRLKGMNTLSDIGRQQTEADTKLSKAKAELGAAQFYPHLQTLNQLSTVLGAYRNPETGQWLGDKAQIAADIKGKYGLDVTPDHMDGIIAMTPDIRKEMSEYRKQQMMEQHHDTRNVGDNAASIERARIMAARPLAGSATNERLRNYKERLTELQTSFYENGGHWANAQDQSEYNSIQTILRSSESAASANIQKGAKEGPASLNILRGKEADTSINPPAANTANGVHPSKDELQIRQILGNTYDPENYEYKIDPNSATGVARRKKVKK